MSLTLIDWHVYVPCGHVAHPLPERIHSEAMLVLATDMSSPNEVHQCYGFSKCSTIVDLADLLENKTIPDAWLGKYIFFLGTTFTDVDNTCKTFVHYIHHTDALIKPAPQLLNVRDLFRDVCKTPYLALIHQ